MLEGELRTAADAGLAIAGLTVSEATIYGRFGFSPATLRDGLVDRDQARAVGRTRDPTGVSTSSPGSGCATSSPSCTAGCAPPAPARSRRGRDSGAACRVMAPGQEGGGKLRAVRYADAGGTTRGIAVYKLVGRGQRLHQARARAALPAERDGRRLRRALAIRPGARPGVGREGAPALGRRAAAVDDRRPARGEGRDRASTAGSASSTCRWSSPPAPTRRPDRSRCASPTRSASPTAPGC